MQTFHERDALRARKVRKHVHAEDAIEASDVNRLREIHRIKGHEAPQSRLDEQMRGAVGCGRARAVGSIRTF